MKPFYEYETVYFQGKQLKRNKGQEYSLCLTCALYNFCINTGNFYKK